MPFLVDSTASTVEVVVSKDTAIGCSEEEYEKYIECLDESILKLTCEPTRFVLRKNLPYEASQKVMNAQATYEKGRVQMQMSFVMEEVRAALIDIKSPPEVPKSDRLEFKRENDGLASKQLISILQGSGVLMDIFRARSAVSSGPKDETAKKK
jgi:hypothetical protein